MSLKWFESICAELNSRPAWATEQIQEFRGRDEAHGLSMQMLHECSDPATQFQILSVLQYTSLRNWEQFEASDRSSVRTCLWAKILGHHTTMPQFVLGKAYQVFALTWKCGWAREDIKSKQQLFDTINSNFLVANSLPGYRAAAELLRATLEEFGQRSSAEIGASLDFHRQAHKTFEKFGLNETFELALQLLSKCVAAMVNLPGGNSAVISKELSAALAHAARLLDTLLQWDFGCPDMLHSDRIRRGEGAVGGLGLLVPPAHWLPRLLNSEMVRALSCAHTRLLLACVHQEGSATTRDSAASAASVWELLVSLTSLSTSAEKDGATSTLVPGFIDALCTATRASLERCADPSASFYRPLLTWAGHDFCEELRSKSVEASVLITQRLLGNWHLKGLSGAPSFDGMLSALIQLLLTLSGELRAISRQSWARVAGLAGVSVPAEDTSGLSVFGTCELLLEGWRGQACMVLLDTWCLLQDDPGLTRASECDTLLTQAQRVAVRRGGSASFDMLFESVLFSALFDALDTMDEDEDEEVEDIVMRDLDDLVSNVAAVGRLHASQSVATVLRYLRESLGLASGLGSSASPASCVFVLETARLGLLFITRILVDADHSAVAHARASGCNGSGEPPQIPPLLLGAIHGLSVTDDASGGALLPALLSASAGGDSAWVVAGELLQLQAVALSQAAQLSSPLVSSLALKFFTAYIRTYVDPDPSLYDPESPGVRLGILNVHGAEFAAPLEAVLGVCAEFLQRLPLEEDVVEAVAGFLGATSRLSRRVDAIVNTSPVQNVFTIITGEACRLSPVGTRLVWASVASIASRCESVAPFEQLLATLRAPVANMAAAQNAATRRALLNDGAAKQTLLHCLAMCSGVALAPLGRTETLARAMDGTLPVLAWFLDGSTGEDLGHVDLLLKPFLSLIRDYAQGHLTALAPPSRSVLYTTTARTIRSLASRLRSGGNGEGDASWQESFLAEVLQLALDVLYLLANQDMFDDAPAPTGAATGVRCMVGAPLAQVSFVQASDILLFGLEVVAPVLTPQLLRTFPAVAEKYFSFLQYILSALDTVFIQWLSGNPAVGAGFLRNMCEQLLWGAGAVDGTAARMALQCLQLLAAAHLRALKSGQAALGLSTVLDPAYGHPTVFIDVMRRLLEMIIYPSSSDYGISWDRIDACANTFITLVALDVPNFESTAKTLIQQQPAHHDRLLVCFDRLTTAQGVSLASVDRPNRIKFVKNMHVFVNEIRPLVMYR